MAKNKLIFLLMLTQINAVAQQYESADRDAFYARQRKEKNEFMQATEGEIERCKLTFSRWYKPNDPDAHRFSSCKQAVLQKITLYNQMQALEACTTFQLKCN